MFAFVAKADGVTFLKALKRLGYEEPRRPAASGAESRLRHQAAAGGEPSQARPWAAERVAVLNRRELLEQDVRDRSPLKLE